MGGGVLALLLSSPGAQSSEGSLQVGQAVSNLWESNPFLRGGAFPFIVQGGAPIYIYLALCLGTVGVRFVLVSRRGPLNRSGVGRHDPGDLLGQGMILAVFSDDVFPGTVPSWLSQDGATAWLVTRGSPPVLSAGAYVSYPRGYLTPPLRSSCQPDGAPGEGCLTEV